MAEQPHPSPPPSDPDHFDSPSQQTTPQDFFQDLPVEAEFLIPQISEITAAPAPIQPDPSSWPDVKAALFDSPARAAFPDLHDARVDLCERLHAANAPIATRTLATITSCCTEGAIIRRHRPQDNHTPFALAPLLCRHRLCPNCARVRSKRVRKEMAARIEKITKRKAQSFHHVVLTVPNCGPLQLSSTLDNMFAAFRKMRRLRTMRAKVSGGMWALEITYNGETRQFHPHLHCIMHSTFIRTVEWTQHWSRSLGKRAYVYTRQAWHSRDGNFGGLLAEVVKYVCKFSSLASCPAEDMATLLTAIAGRRQYAVWGSFLSPTAHAMNESAEHEAGAENLAAEDLPAALYSTVARIEDVIFWAAQGHDPCRRFLSLLISQNHLRAEQDQAGKHASPSNSGRAPPSSHHSSSSSSATSTPQT